MDKKTWDDLSDRLRFLNARSTIETLLACGIIPIINENDTKALWALGCFVQPVGPIAYLTIGARRP